MAVPADSGVEAYLQHVIVERVCRPTIAAYRRDLGQFQRWLGEVGIRDLADVTAAKLGQFVAWASRRAPGVRPRSGAW